MSSNRWTLVLFGITTVVTLTLCGCPPQTPALSVDVTADKTSGNPPLAILATAVPNGGVAPYTFQWSSAPGGLIGAPTAASTNVSFALAGTYTVTCTITDSAGQTASDSVQVAVGTTAPTGNAATGQAIYNQRCVGCHPSAVALKPAAGAIVTNLGSLSPAMNGITLTDQEVLDLKAYLNSL